jgi:predicted nucleotidyltransferase
MQIPKGIEGDYLETKENNLFFDIKGYHHPQGRKICFLRYYQDANGERIKEGKKYKKIYSLDERYLKLREDYPQYLFFSNELDLELQGVEIKDIKKIYTPRDFYAELKSRKILSENEKQSKNLCELFIAGGSVPEDAIGISGSPMIGLSNENSDIDVILYGTRVCLEFQDKLKKLLLTSNKCRMYNLSDYKTHYNWRVGGSGISFENFLRSEKRKLHQGKFHGIDFFIRYVKSPNDWNGTFYDYKFKNLGRIKIKAKIVDSTDSIFSPCSYKINVIEVVDKNLIINDLNLENITEINSFRGRFCEHAKKGETVLVKGKLEEIIFKGKEKHLRILLTYQTQDIFCVISL